MEKSQFLIDINRLLEKIKTEGEEIMRLLNEIEVSLNEFKDRKNNLNTDENGNK